jgi:glucan phosphorylase
MDCAKAAEDEIANAIMSFFMVVLLLFRFHAERVGSCMQIRGSAQRRIDKLWMSSFDWNRKSILNIAHMAWFSSDRAIAEYAQEVWNVPFTRPADAASRRDLKRS